MRTLDWLGGLIMGLILLPVAVIKGWRKRYALKGSCKSYEPREGK